MYAHQRRDLADVADVLTPDLRGFGSALLGAEQPSLDRLADDVAGQLDEGAVQRAVVGGTSMGGYVAMAFARRHPHRLAGLLLANTKAEADAPEAAANRLRIADLVERDASVQVLHDEIEPKLLGTTSRTSRPDVVAEVHELVAGADPGAVAWAQRAMARRPDSMPTLGACEVPALVIVGEEDELMPASAGPAMADALGAAQLVRLPEAGHLGCLESSMAWSEAVRAFLAGVSD
jgi:pimeloyl-ACP methyl ester carboxylesterase